MKLNLSKSLVDHLNKPVLGPDGKALSLGGALSFAVTGSSKHRGNDVEAKRRRGYLAFKLAEDGEVEFTQDEIKVLAEDTTEVLSGVALVVVERAMGYADKQ